MTTASRLAEIIAVTCALTIVIMLAQEIVNERKRRRRIAACRRPGTEPAATPKAVTARHPLRAFLGRHGRRRVLQGELPYLLDTCLICAEVGYTIDMTFARLAENERFLSPAMAAEVGLCHAELQIMPRRAMVFERLALRSGLAELGRLARAMARAEDEGTPLAPTLARLAEEIRRSRLLEAEERAMRLPALLTLPLMVMVMPAVFVFTGAPAVLMVLEALK